MIEMQCNPTVIIARQSDASAGMSSITDKQLSQTEKQFKQFEAMICSMTPEERSNPDLLAKACPPSPARSWVGKGFLAEFLMKSALSLNYLLGHTPAAPLRWRAGLWISCKTRTLMFGEFSRNDTRQQVRCETRTHSRMQNVDVEEKNRLRVIDPGA